MKKKPMKAKRLGPPIQVRLFNEDVAQARELAFDWGIELSQVLRRSVRVGIALLKEEDTKATKAA